MIALKKATKIPGIVLEILGRFLIRISRRPQTIYFVRHDSDYGPFFSSHKEVEEYMSYELGMSSDNCERAFHNLHPYTGVTVVTLGDNKQIFAE
jgi:hypothetical protein